MNEHPATLLRCVVERITYQNPENGYSVLKVKVKGYSDLVTLVGNLLEVPVGSVLLCRGEWKVDKRYGSQFVAATWEETMPATVYGIEKYLGSGLVKGIGPRFARAIVQRFGTETIDIIETDIERLYEVPNIGRKRVAKIRESWEKQKDIKNVMLFLQGYGVSTAYAAKIYREYGKESIEKVRENPYLLSGEACGVEFSVTDGIAMGMGLAADSDQRLQAAVTFELSHNENNGHVFLPRNKLISATTQLLDSGAELVEQALDSLIERGAVVQEQVAHVEACYLRRLWEAECSACIRLAGLLAADTDRSAQAGRAVDELEAHLTDIDYDKAAAYEKKLRHDVMAHVHTYGEACPKAMPIIHLGATSCYVGDNTDVILMREALLLVRDKLVRVLARLTEFAEQYKALPTLGFTHFQPAQLVTVGKRATLWMNELLMDLEEVEHRIASLKLLGSKGITTPEERPQTEASGVIAELRSAVLDGNTYYFIRLEGEEVFYSVSASQNEVAVILNVGDSVTIEHEVPQEGSESLILDGYTITSHTRGSSAVPAEPSASPEPQTGAAA